MATFAPFESRECKLVLSLIIRSPTHLALRPTLDCRDLSQLGGAYGRVARRKTLHRLLAFDVYVTFFPSLMYEPDLQVSFQRLLS